MDSHADVAPNPLTAHDLATQDGRIAFLWSLWEDYQEPGLLAATHHVWGSLAAPAGTRCTLMAQRLGVPGKGKAALAGVLAHYLATVNAVDFPDLPDRAAYADGEAWSADCLAHFDHVRKLLLAVMLRYESILDGRDPDAVAPPEGTVITGPWRSRGA